MLWSTNNVRPSLQSRHFLEGEEQAGEEQVLLETLELTEEVAAVTAVAARLPVELVEALEKIFAFAPVAVLSLLVLFEVASLQ